MVESKKQTPVRWDLTGVFLWLCFANDQLYEYKDTNFVHMMPLFTAKTSHLQYKTQYNEIENGANAVFFAQYYLNLTLNLYL